MKKFLLPFLSAIALIGCGGGGGTGFSHRVPTAGAYQIEYSAFSSEGTPTVYSTGIGRVIFGSPPLIEELAADSVHGNVLIVKRVLSEDNLYLFEIFRRPTPYQAIGYLARQPDGSYLGDFEDLFLPIKYKMKFTPLPPGP